MYHITFTCSCTAAWCYALAREHLCELVDVLACGILDNLCCGRGIHMLLDFVFVALFLICGAFAFFFLSLSLLHVRLAMLEDSLLPSDFFFELTALLTARSRGVSRAFS